MDMDFDRNKIQRILLNLLSNAVKYNYENGEVIVALDKITANGTENAQIQVADTGIGIKIKYSTVFFKNNILPLPI